MDTRPFISAGRRIKKKGGETMAGRTGACTDTGKKGAHAEYEAGKGRHVDLAKACGICCDEVA